MRSSRIFLNKIFASTVKTKQDICFNSKDLIDSERNAVDLYEQRDSKGQISFTSFKIWNILDKTFVPIDVQ
jgi:hypothetical protein